MYTPSIRLFLMVLFTGLCPLLKAQDISYAKEVIDSLCSETMKGRGYVGNGDRTAAHYLAGEFERLGLKKYSKSYFQNFSTPVNSFPGKMSLSVNGKSLKPGDDFLVDPGSPGVSGKFGIELLTADDLLKDDVLHQKLKNAYFQVYRGKQVTTKRNTLRIR